MPKPKEKTRERKVCLISHHPLVLQEMGRRLDEGGFAVLLHAVRPGQPKDLREFPLPEAETYVADAPPGRLASESLATGIIERHPASPVVVIAESFTEANAFPLLQIGVRGLVAYAEARERLCDAVRSVSAGGFWVSRALLLSFVETVAKRSRNNRRAQSDSGLSPREQEVFNAVVENLSNKEIASQLHISERTAKFHVSNLLAKFGVRRRADLILISQGHAHPA